MLRREHFINQLPHTLQSIELPFLGDKIAGKVRDSFIVGDKRVLITSDRLSAFDRILTTLPFKGQILNCMAAYWFDLTRHIVDNHLIAQPHPNVLITQQVKIVPVELVVRGYLTGSAGRDYEAGRAVSGVMLPRGLKKFQRFETPIITPSTKAEHGQHDEPISVEEVLSRGIVEEQYWREICRIALELFEFGSAKSRERGLILVDTKYEFGLLALADGSKKIVLADEIHTPDSSRYWMAESYQDRFDRGEEPQMLDKEHFRRWLISLGYMGEGTPPAIPDEMRIELAWRYAEACELVTGQPLEVNVGPAEDAIGLAVKATLASGTL